MIDLEKFTDEELLEMYQRFCPSPLILIKELVSRQLI